MSISTAQAQSQPVRLNLKQYRGAKTFVARFVALRTMRSAVFIGLVFGAYVASKAAGFAATFPTEKSRTALSASFGNNIGFRAILGVPHGIDSVSGFTVWNTLGVMALIGSIWALIVATKTFRGEEDAGRRELLLAGQTTAGRAAANTLIGLWTSLFVLYGVVACTFIAVGTLNTVNFDVGSALFFALAASVSAAIFMTLGAFLSQLMPTRGRAVSATTAVFGIAFIVRAAADTASVDWLRSLSPLGWVEQLQPLHNSQPVWLIPLFATAIILSILTVLLAWQRDLGGSIFADRDSAKPHTRLLGSAFASAVRLTRFTSLGWLFAIGAVGLAFGRLTKPAAQALSDSLGAAHVVARIANAVATTSAVDFLGITFFLMMVLIMSYAASAVGKVREEEAEGYLDNFLVQPISRLKWLSGRIFLILVVTGLASIIITLCIWLGIANQNLDVTFNALLQASLNALTPALFIIGAGIFTLGFLPRFTTLVAFGIIAWSFLITMVSSGLNLNEWILNTSVFHHVTLAPAVNPDWHANAIIIGIGIVLCILGVWRFTQRDLENA